MNLNSWQTVPWNPLPAKTIGIISIEANDAHCFLRVKNAEHFVLAIEIMIKIGILLRDCNDFIIIYEVL